MRWVRETWPLNGSSRSLGFRPLQVSGQRGSMKKQGRSGGQQHRDSQRDQSLAPRSLFWQPGLCGPRAAAWGASGPCPPQMLPHRYEGGTSAGAL